jgi:ATP-dependent Lhr-like helicase
VKGWPVIRSGKNVLIAAPTGSGKTLTAFLACLDELFRAAADGTLEDQTRVLYVSPLKALGNDVQKNLLQPLERLTERAAREGVKLQPIRVMVRTGDTPAHERAAMVKKPPHILITTPESLYLLLTSRRGREGLKSVETVIVDEVHALAGNRRGAHLALSLERLEALLERPLQRIGLSATQKPLELVARFLTGNRENRPGGDSAPCAVVDAGRRRAFDFQIEIPPSGLSAVMALEVWEEVYARLLALIAEHRTTLIFTGTRRLAERIAHRLRQTLGDEAVAAHHGSMSRERRLDAEQRLKTGALRAMVATASLELGIDIGSVDLVLQIGSPRTLNAFLQRAGRSRHQVGGIPKARLFPLTSTELVEAAALLRAVRLGELDALWIPEAPLDVLAQQIVAEAAGRSDSRSGRP